MRKLYLILIIGFLMTACTDGDLANRRTVKSSFDSPFEKRTKNLTWKLGDEFLIKHNKDTKQNLIIQKSSKDTIFAGLISKYKGLYYFNQQLNDTSYWIYAVKIEEGFIRGLNSGWFQMLAWDNEFEGLLMHPEGTSNIISPVLKYIDTNNQIIRLTPEKKTMRTFYEAIIDSLPADTLIDWYQSSQDDEREETEAELQKTTPARTSIIEKFYPNPATNNVIFMLATEGSILYEIFDMNGSLVITGQMTSIINNIDISDLKRGTYFVSIYRKDSEEVETVKLIKK